MKQQIVIKVRTKIPSMGDIAEYMLLPYVVNGNNTYFLNSCGWNGYGKTANEAKADLKTRPDFVNIVDHLFDDVVITHNSYPAAELVNYIP